MRKLDRLTIINLAIAGLILLLILGVWLSQRRDSPDDQPITNTLGHVDSRAEAAKLCASQRTYDLIKRELFRRAAQARGTDHSAFDRLSAAAVVRMEDPLMSGRDEELGAVSCSGQLSLDLPPGVAVVGGRRTLQAKITYRLQPAADGSGMVPMVEGADAIVVPLATLARTSSPSGPSAIVEPAPVPPAPLPPSAVQPPVAGGEAPAPSFNCRFARTRGELAVCGDPGLAALDRQMAAQYQRAIAAADPQRRQWLRATRDSFLRYRDRCPSSACVADAYRGRMREIDDIMTGRWRPGR